MKSVSTKHLRRTILCALFAGIVTVPFAAQTAYALPIEGAHAETNAGEANISTSGAVMDITGKTEYNVLRWEDFSIDSGEKVRFDGGSQTRDYLNLVTGEGASNIYGTIEGGRNVYLVNPHGILFAEGSQVNTGALYLSTANIADVNVSSFGGGSSPLSATEQMGDVLNLGTVKASKVYIEGRNVTVLSTDAVTDTGGAALTGADKVIIRSENTPHIGYDVGDKTAPSTTASDYANANTAKSATGRGWDVKKLGGGAAHTDYDYMCVHDVYDLQNIHAKLDGRYMLARDIDASATATWDGGKGFAPIGNNSNRFTGRFDGVRHTIRGLQIKRPNESYVGLFGTAKNARIENVSLVDGNVKGDQRVGGIVGTMENSTVQNVSNAGQVEVPGNFVGGIVGEMIGGTVQNASNAGQVKGWMNIGGIVGAMSNGTIQNASNVGAVAGSFVGGIVGAVTVGTVRNVWNAGQVTGNQSVGGIAGKMSGGKVIQAVWKTGTAAHAVDPDNNTAFEKDRHEHTEEEMKQAATYANWKDESGNPLVATEGGKGTPWRIYDGKTMPLLTGLMKGTKRLAKVYDGKAFGDGDAHIHFDTPAEKNVGTYSAADVYSDPFGYDLIGSTYRIAPRVLTLSGIAAQTKGYDGNTNADAAQFSATLGNIVTGEESLVSATATGAAYNSKDVASASKVTYTGLALTGTGAANYTVATTAEGAGTITARALTLGAVAAQTKTYDGTRAADASKFSAGLNNTVAGDSVTATAAGATYNSKDVAGANTVNYTGVALGGADAGNYSLAAVAQGTGTITRRALTFDAVAAQTKIYDGNTNADAAQFSATLGNIVAGEENSVSATAAGAEYNDKNVAGANKVSYTGVALGGTGAGNYSIADTAQGKGTITKRALTLGTVTAQTKIYDGTTAADAGKFSAALTNAIAGDSVAATATGAAYNSKNVAAASTIDYTGVALAGAEAGNYSLAATTAQGTGTISRRALTVDTVAAQSKTYDGTRAADASKFSAALGNAIAGDSVTATATGAAYNDHNVAAARTIDYTGVSLGGSDAGNYSLAATAAQGEGRITPKELNLALAGGARFDKTYDGTANVAQSLTRGTNYNLNGFVTGEGTDIELSAVTGKYADKNAAADKEVTFDGLTLRGADAANYVLNKTALTGTGTIAKRTLTLGAVTAQTKIYNGTTAADASQFHAALNNAVAGDNVTSAATGATYNDKNVAGASRINYTGVNLAGADAGNYTLAATTAQGAGTITHRTLTLTAAPHSIVQGEPLPSFTGRAEGFADGEDAAVFGAGDLMFESAVTNTETPGSYGVTGRIGGITDGILGNYRIVQATGNATAFTIHAAALPGGLLASLIQDAAPRFDFGFGDAVYLYGTARPIRAATLGFYRFDAEDDLEIQSLRL